MRTRPTLVMTLLVVGLIIVVALIGANLIRILSRQTTYGPTTPILPTPTPKPILTVQGEPPAVSASVAYLVDMDTGHILVDINGEKPAPMASTTKIMTALIAIQTGDLNQPVTVKQDAYDNVLQNSGSSANLVVGDVLPLHDLLYGLMLPSGDDAAIAIADALAGTPDKFVQTMNLFAYHLHLFQTHYLDPDGLTVIDDQGQPNPNHYTTAADLTRLTRYALSNPLFAQIVQRQYYHVAAAGEHQAYTWTNTNELLQNYVGTNGIKTGYTSEAGYCLVFAATRAEHHLIGVILHDISSDQRFEDAKVLLNWGFALPLLAPT